MISKIAFLFMTLFSMALFETHYEKTLNQRMMTWGETAVFAAPKEQTSMKACESLRQKDSCQTHLWRALNRATDEARITLLYSWNSLNFTNGDSVQTFRSKDRGTTFVSCCLFLCRKKVVILRGGDWCWEI
jgi:hypothetical protein